MHTYSLKKEAVLSHEKHNVRRVVVIQRRRATLRV
jgi:hypothetical protein